MATDPRILAKRYLVKTVKFRAGQDFWNSFLASITKNTHADAPNDPLAHLHVRRGPRKPDIQATYGMMPTDDSGSLRWGLREFIDNPDPTKRDAHPKVHSEAMYSPEIKAAYSKPLSATYLNLSQNIRPNLFGADGQICSGVMIPLNQQHVLINRIFKSDGWTYNRPYDSGHKTPQMVDSLDILDSLPDLKGISKNFSEILARMKWVSQSEEDHSFFPPCLLVCFSANIETLVKSILVTVVRALDIKFTLLRKFRINSEIPIVLYNSSKLNPEDVFENVINFTGIENIFSQILGVFIPDLKEKFQSPTPPILMLISKINFLKGIFCLAQSQVAQPNFQSFLQKGPIDKMNPFYLETFKTILAHAHQIPELDKIHPAYKTLIDAFRDLSPDEHQARLLEYGYLGDFSEAAFGPETKVNPAHPFSRLPVKRTPDDK